MAFNEKGEDKMKREFPAKMREWALRDCYTLG